MKLIKHITEFEGSPEEYERARLSELFGSRGGAQDASSNGSEGVDVVSGTTRTLPAHVIDFLENRVRGGDARAVVEEFIDTTLGWEGVTVQPAGGQSEGKYVSIYRRGSNVGAIAYVHRRYAHLRLPADAAEGTTYARARDVQSSNPHQVVVPLDDRAALEEALALLRKAYDEAI